MESFKPARQNYFLAMAFNQETVPTAVVSPTETALAVPVAAADVPRPQTAASPAKAAPGLYPAATLRGIDYLTQSTSETAQDLQWSDEMAEPDMVLELADGLAFAGTSFGADKSVAGECVFQTGKSIQHNLEARTLIPTQQAWSATQSR